ASRATIVAPTFFINRRMGLHEKYSAIIFLHFFGFLLIFYFILKFVFELIYSLQIFKDFGVYLKIVKKK
ncbi:unnamed protein product, partial [marine sediment metagenome]